MKFGARFYILDLILGLILSGFGMYGIAALIADGLFIWIVPVMFFAGWILAHVFILVGLSRYTKEKDGRKAGKAIKKEGR